MDTLIDVGNRLNAQHRRVISCGERLHHNEVIGNGLLVLQVNTVVLGVGGSRFLHRLRVLALLGHLVGLQNHLVIAIAMEVTAGLSEVRQQRFDHGKVIVGLHPADAMA